MFNWLIRLFGRGEAAQPKADPAQDLRQKTIRLLERIHAAHPELPLEIPDVKRTLEQVPMPEVESLHQKLKTLARMLVIAEGSCLPVIIIGYEPDHEAFRMISLLSGKLGTYVKMAADGSAKICERGHAWNDFSGELDPELVRLNLELALLAAKIQENAARANQLRRKCNEMLRPLNHEQALLEFGLWDLLNGAYKNQLDLELAERNGLVCLTQNGEILEPLPEEVGRPLLAKQASIRQGLDDCDAWAKEAKLLDEWGKHEPRRLELLREGLAKALKGKLPEIHRLWREGEAIILVRPEGLKIIVHEEIDRVLEQIPDELRERIALEIKYSHLELPEPCLKALGLVLASAQAAAPETSDDNKGDAPTG